LAIDMIVTEPGIDRVRLLGYEATDKLMPGVVKAEGLVELRAKVAAHDAARIKASGSEQA
jgi:hypothetical protein